MNINQQSYIFWDTQWNDMEDSKLYDVIWGSPKKGGTWNGDIIHDFDGL